MTVYLPGQGNRQEFETEEVYLPVESVEIVHVPLVGETPVIVIVTLALTDPNTLPVIIPNFGIAVVVKSAW